MTPQPAPLIALVLGGLAVIMSACQSQPPKAEMMATVCDHNPCREAREIELIDQTGQAHRLQIPAGPIFVHGWLSVVTGESHSLALQAGPDNTVHANWLAGAVGGGGQRAFQGSPKPTARQRDSLYRAAPIQPPGSPSGLACRTITRGREPIPPSGFADHSPGPSHPKAI